MKILYSLLFAIITTTGCKRITDQDIINSAAIHFSVVFITENIHSLSSLRLEGRPVVKKETDSTYHVSGSVEGFSPFNYPVSIKYFSETLHYLGGDPNERKNWVCIEIYVGNKKMK
jgi:hypothetical protein